MRSIVARLLFLAGITVNVTGSDVQVVETDETEEGAKLRGVRFSARLAKDEVLVVRCERRQNGRVVLETEAVFGFSAAAAGLVVRLRRIGPDCWQILDGAAEQYLQGVTIAKWEISEAALDLAFTPDLLRAQKCHAMTWRATTEKWSEAQARHPHLPRADAPAEQWPVRSTNYPALVAAR